LSSGLSIFDFAQVRPFLLNLMAIAVNKYTVLAISDFEDGADTIFMCQIEAGETQACSSMEVAKTVF
jgi:hypothetical protein